MIRDEPQPALPVAMRGGHDPTRQPVGLREMLDAPRREVGGAGDFREAKHSLKRRQPPLSLVILDDEPSPVIAELTNLLRQLRRKRRESLTIEKVDSLAD